MNRLKMRRTISSIEISRADSRSPTVHILKGVTHGKEQDHIKKKKKEAYRCHYSKT
jgi:hypothetical protein